MLARSLAQSFRFQVIGASILLLLGSAVWVSPVVGQDDATVAAIRKNAEQLSKAFNAGKPDDFVALFLAKGELIDEEGNAYVGQAAIKDILTKYFAKYPGAKMTAAIETIRLLGPLAIEEGTRTTSTKDGVSKAEARYLTIWVKGNNAWQIASTREFANDPIPTSHDRLEALAWLVGDWVNEGVDAVVEISYRWSEDKNFLLGEFKITPPGKPAVKSSQRIGWDPALGKIRSWLFDADGGFAEGVWTQVEDEYVIKSNSVNPDGEAASATVTLSVIDKDHFSMEGTERIVGESREPDFEITVTRRAPAPRK